MILLVLGCFIAVCFGCVSREDRVKSFIPGIYIASWHSAYSLSKDTLKIEPAVIEGSESYLITRRTSVEYIDPSKMRKPMYKIVKWVAVYSVSSRTLTVTNNGRVLSFDVIAGTMRMGETVYRKL